MEKPVAELSPDDAAQLTDEQIESKVTDVEVPPKSDEPPAEPSPKDTPPKTDTPPIEPLETPPAKEPAPEPEKLYAGKYKTTDDLAKGLIEIAKPLNYNPKVLEHLVEMAKKTGDWDAVADSYVSLSETLAQKGVPPKAPDSSLPALPIKPGDTTVTDTEFIETQEAHKIVIEETYKELEKTSVVRELSELGVAVPKTQAQWDQLKVDYPYQAMQLNQEITRIATGIRDDLKNYANALKTVDSHNEEITKSEKTKIAEFANEYGLKLDDAKLKEITDAALKSDFVYEDRHGVRFIRENGLFKHFLAEHFPTLAKAIKTNGELEGRTQHAEDLKDMKKKSLSSISTVPVTPTRKQDPVIDVNDPDQTATLSDDDIEKRLS